MRNTSLERAPSARAGQVRPQNRTLRRAAMLVGTGLFLQAEPVLAANECGPPPFPGGTIICPAGEYPNGISYFVPFGATEFRLEPGFVARGNSLIEGSNIRIIGPVNTSFSPLPGQGNPFIPVALNVFVLGPVFIDIDDVQAVVQGHRALQVLGSRSVTVNADSVTSVGAAGISVVEIFHDFAPPSVPITGIGIRVNMVSTTGSDGRGIYASSEQGDVVIESGTVTTTGESSAGIVVERARATTISAGTVTTAGGNSPAIRGSGSPTLSITSGTLVTRGAGSTGISAQAGSAIAIASGSISTSGASSRGIETSGTGTVNIVAREIETVGEGSPAILISQTGLGPTTVEFQKLTTRGLNSSGILVSAQTGSVTIKGGTIIALSPGGTGMSVNGLGDITISSDSIRTTLGEGIGVGTGGKVTISSREVTAVGWTGIRALSGQGISITSDTVTTTGSGAPAILAATGRGDVQVVSRLAETSGRNSHAIWVQAFQHSSTVTAGTTRTLGDNSDAIFVTSFGPGNISVSNQQITTAGSDSFGVRATATTGTINLSSNGDVVTSGRASTGLGAETRGAIVVSANNVSATGPDSDAIAVNGSTSLVTVRGLVQSSQGMAVRGAGGPVTVNIVAGGTVRGRVSLTANPDRIANAGIFEAIGTSQFGAGTDVFDNASAGIVRSMNGAAALAGLESFGNAGLIDLRDGSTGDSLTLAGYAGTGGRLGLDVDFTTRVADRLITGAATGSTLIEVLPVGVGTPTVSGILLVDSGPGTSPTAFALAPGTDSPYLRSILRFDAANNDFLLDRALGTAVFETARFGAMASQLWHESADAVAAQLDTVRDGRRGRGIAAWLQGWTGERERSGAQTFGTDTFDVSFEQDFQGLQGGLDFQAGSGVVGITAGTGRSDALFAATGNPVDMEVGNVGLYAQIGSGPLFFNALAKRDWAELEIAPGAGLGAEFDADLFGVQFNAGLRLAFGALYAEPSVGLSWVQADLDSFESGPATVEPGSVDSLRARAGLRVGARLPLAGGDLLPYVAAHVYEELGDRNASEFTLGETLRLFDEPAGTRGQAAAGLSFVKPGFEAFVRGEMDFSGGTDAKAVRAGARIRF